MVELSASEQIDAIVKRSSGWRGETLARLRALVLKAAPDVVEEVKWKNPSKPEGVPVWSHNGILCIADTLEECREVDVPKRRSDEGPQAPLQRASR